MIVGLVAAVLYCRLNPQAHLEHGPLENFQAIMLTVSALLLGGVAPGLKGAQRVFAFGLALFCFVFLLLEFDTRQFGNSLLRTATNGAVRNVWVGVLVALYAATFWPKRDQMLTQIGRWLRDRAGLLMLIAGGFWVTGALFEHGSFFSDRDVTLMLEEVVEVNAALFMAWSALETTKLLKRADDAKASTHAAPP
jgi:hypothetical protein